MKIQICGSMTFAKEMKAAKRTLEEKGHSVTIPTNTDRHVEDPLFADNLKDNLAHCIENNTIKENFNLVANADAILVVNYPKNDINGYIGTSTLMEIGLAHYLGKKIFILHDIPHFDTVRWAHEITIMQPIILHGNLQSFWSY